MKKRIVSIQLIILFICLFSQCSNQIKDKTIVNGFEIERIVNKGEQEKSEEFLTLEKIQLINFITNEYEISQFYGMDGDEDNNLYVIDNMEAKVVVFDNSGKYLKTLGGRGMGPRELMDPRYLICDENRLFIYEAGSGIKILDLEGKYIGKKDIQHTIGNFSIFKPSLEYYFALTYYYEETKKVFNFYKYNTEDERLNNKKLLLSFMTDRGTQYSYFPEYALAFDKDNNFYFPETKDNYSVIKYNDIGTPVLAFGRQYTRTPYSKEANEKYEAHREWYNSRVGNVCQELCRYPMVISKIMIDSRNNLWIASGELSDDSDNKSKIPVTVDIFTNEGIWLTSIEITGLTKKSIIKNDRLYIATENSEMYEQDFIQVYKITYNDVK